MRHFFRTLLVIYTCISLTACATKRLIDYAEKTAETGTLQWRIEKIEFAAIRDDRYLRMCIGFSHTGETTSKELAVDLEQITGLVRNGNESADNFINGINAETSLCNHNLETGEKKVNIREHYSDARDLATALEALDTTMLDAPEEELEIVLLQHASENHLVFRTPLNMLVDLDKHAMHAYMETEKNVNPYLMLLLPLTLATDAALIAVSIILIVLCVIPIFLMMCIPAKVIVGSIDNAMENDDYDYEPAQEDVLIEDY